MTSSPIYHLPEELLDRICHFTPNLHSLCLVNKNLNRIATAHLYTTISLSHSNFKHLRSLTLMLWTSPKHRALVRSISVRRAYGGDLVPWPEHADLDGVISEQVEMYVREGERESWCKQVRDGMDPLPIASLLLRSLQRVRRMGFDGFELVDPGGRG